MLMHSRYVYTAITRHVLLIVSLSVTPHELIDPAMCISNFFYQNVIGYQRKLFECFQVTIITGLNVIVNEKKQATLMGNV